MLYTSMPLERIYSTRFSQSGVNRQQAEEAVYSEVSLPHGHIRTRTEGDQSYVDSIFTTNLSDYLNPEYMPGAIYKITKE